MHVAAADLRACAPSFRVGSPACHPPTVRTTLPAPPCRRPDRPVVMAASMLAYDSVDALTHDQHLALLRFLADAVLDSERMRGLLQSEWGSDVVLLVLALLAETAGSLGLGLLHRVCCVDCLPAPACFLSAHAYTTPVLHVLLPPPASLPAEREDEALDVKRDVREEISEQRKQLKELLDAEKEERKRKREEERKKQEEEKAAAEEAAAAAAAAAAEGGEAAGQQQEGALKSLSKQASAAATAMEVDGQVGVAAEACHCGALSWNPTALGLCCAPLLPA